MRLQKKLLHKILRYAEEHAHGQNLAAPEFEQYSRQEVNYHIGLCAEAKFLHTSPSRAEPGSEDIPTYMIRNLTWEGHLELDEKRHVCQK